MSNAPFKVASGLAQVVRRATEGYAVPSPTLEVAPVRASGSRRRRLWEIPHRLHCPVVGVCFDCDELRALMKKVMHFPPETSDYVLHTTAVGNCEQRGQLAELLQRTLEQRFRLTLKSLSAVKDADALRKAWDKACSEGKNVPAMLWACWTHPALDTELEQEIFGDIHMLQHQLGSGTRADLDAMRRLNGENVALRQQLASAQAAVEEIRTDKAAAVFATERTLAETRSELAAATASGERLARELQELHESLPDLRHAQALLRRISLLEVQADAARQKNALLERELVRMRDLARDAEGAFEALSRDAAELQASQDELPERDLAGKRVLCVGGRSGSLRSYRDVVEQSGGEFLHHDGGLEESAHRIDSVVAAADIVICQAGCISHNAYWRVKEHCKRTGKRCVFVKSAGVASFDRAVGEVSEIVQIVEIVRREA
ncbi:MAG: hypothetical protein QG584_2477 [Pseudomonadota bacterium]|nr:hypothetical protein [Pseudomonadota bacterium]